MKDSWKNLFKNKILASLTIGTIIILIGSLFHIQELIWIGVGTTIPGWYFIFRGND